MSQVGKKGSIGLYRKTSHRKMICSVRSYMSGRPIHTYLQNFSISHRSFPKSNTAPAVLVESYRYNAGVLQKSVTASDSVANQSMCLGQIQNLFLFHDSYDSVTNSSERYALYRMEARYFSYLRF